MKGQPIIDQAIGARLPLIADRRSGAAEPASSSRHVPAHTIPIEGLPSDWTTRETHSQALGDEWLDKATEAVLIVPSVIIPVNRAVDRNVLINHRHAGAARMAISAVRPFTLDPRLFWP